MLWFAQGYELDGHSLFPALFPGGKQTAPPRDFTFSEFFLACSCANPNTSQTFLTSTALSARWFARTWRKLRLASYTDSLGVSRRLAFHAWCTNQTEICVCPLCRSPACLAVLRSMSLTIECSACCGADDLDADRYQLNDLSSSFPTADLRRLTALSVIIGECGGAACSKPLAELLPLADEHVARAVEARQFTERQLRVDENIPTSLACCKRTSSLAWLCAPPLIEGVCADNGVNTVPWCCGQPETYTPRGGTAVKHEYDCQDVVPPTAP